jgi:hypothetical protein
MLTMQMPKLPFYQETQRHRMIISERFLRILAVRPGCSI